MKISLSIQQEPFDVTRETIRLGEASAAIGAIVSFVGLVRDINDGRGVTGLYLEHYPGMAEKEIEKILIEAGHRWPLESLRVVHRVGELKPTDPIVFVGVASQHRSDAFRACEFIMDYLKTRAPFWKKEQRIGSGPGDADWLEAKASDLVQQSRWE